MSASIRPLHPTDLPLLQQAAAADRHILLYPTHVVWKEGAIVGYASVCATPVVHVWLDSQQVKALDSVRLLQQLDAHLVFNGRPGYVMPCAKDSPFFPHMQRLGFTVLGENVWHHKSIKQEG